MKFKVLVEDIFSIIVCKNKIYCDFMENVCSIVKSKETWNNIKDL